MHFVHLAASIILSQRQLDHFEVFQPIKTHGAICEVELFSLVWLLKSDCQ